MSNVSSSLHKRRKKTKFIAQESADGGDISLLEENSKLSSSPDSVITTNVASKKPIPKISALKRTTIHSPSEPKTPVNFYVNRSSLLDLDAVMDLDHDHSTEPKSQLSFDGFVNLGIIFLVSTCLLLAVENYAEKGILVDLELLQCMTGDFSRCLDLLILIGCQLTSVYVVSRIQMFLFLYVFYRAETTRQQKKPRSSFLASLCQYACSVGYALCSIGFFSSVVYFIFLKRVSLLVCCVITLTLMVCTMKIHSYYVYVFKTFHFVSPPLQGKENKTAKSSPDVVSLKEYMYFIVSPTLCFFRKYPKTNTIRIGYVLKEFGLLMGSLFMMYIIVMQYIDPVIREHQYETIGQTIHSLLRISVPWFITWLLASFAVFHAFLNLIAELTYFGDRLWYKDWWNARTFEELWKLWNRPVHHWLLRHVYFESIRLKYNRPLAILFTFLLSAVIHELCMGVIFRSVQFYFFAAMLIQVPFIYVSNRLQEYEDRYEFLKTLGNMSMWLSLFAGQPLMMLLYFKNWYANERALCDRERIALSSSYDVVNDLFQKLQMS